MSRTKSESFKPTLEVLEERSLMAAGITASWSQGILKIYGTDYGDRIVLREQGSRVTLDGFTGSLDASQIRGIGIYAKGGSDTVGLAISAQLASRIYADGGTGTDTFFYVGRPNAAGFEKSFNIGAYSSERSVVDAAFPNLKGQFEVMAPSTRSYNCIAWSLGYTNRWIDPAKTLAAFDKLNYQNGGWVRSNSMDFSKQYGMEKIVLYGKKDAYGRITEFTHQARQEADGTWSSKLGGLALIRHLTPQALSGQSYGEPVAVYYRYR